MGEGAPPRRASPSAAAEHGGKQDRRPVTGEMPSSAPIRPPARHSCPPSCGLLPPTRQRSPLERPPSPAAPAHLSRDGVLAGKQRQRLHLLPLVLQADGGRHARRRRGATRPHLQLHRADSAAHQAPKQLVLHGLQDALSGRHCIGPFRQAWGGQQSQGGTRGGAGVPLPAYLGCAGLHGRSLRQMQDVPLTMAPLLPGAREPQKRQQ